MNEFQTLYDAIEPYTIVSKDRCEMLYRLSKYASTLEGEIAEVGTYRGGTAMLLSKANSKKKIHSFDTFRGIPNATAEDGHPNGDFADIDEGTIKRLEDEGIIVHQGVFPGTADGVDGPFCFANFDADTYQSCKDFCAFFWNRTVNGGILVFDDWQWPQCAGVERAVTELCARTGAVPFHTAQHQVAVVVANPQRREAGLVK